MPRRVSGHRSSAPTEWQGAGRRAAGSDGQLTRILARCEQLDALQRALAEVLPPEVDGRVRVADLHGGELVVAVPTPAWAARLRYLLPQLVAAAGRSRRLHSIRRARIAVDPRLDERTGQARPMPRLPASAAELLDAVATDAETAAPGNATASDSTRLADGLRRLAQRAREQPSGTGHPGNGSPGTDSPGTDSPGTDSPGTDSPGTDNTSRTTLRNALQTPTED